MTKKQRTSTIDIDERVKEVLSRPYARMITPDEDGTFFGQIIEFPGCLATGDTPEEAMASLERAAEGWLAAAIANGQHVSEPIDVADVSGRLVLRMPKSLHQKAASIAGREGVSLNRFIVTTLAERVGERTEEARHRVISTANVAAQAFATAISVFGVEGVADTWAGPSVSGKVANVMATVPDYIAYQRVRAHEMKNG